MRQQEYLFVLLLTGLFYGNAAFSSTIQFSELPNMEVTSPNSGLSVTHDGAPLDNGTHFDTTDSKMVSSLSTVQLLLRVVYTIVGLLGVSDNFIVVLVILKTEHMRKSLGNCFILNQSLLDLISSVALLAHPYLNDLNLVQSHIGKVLLCKLWIVKWFMWGLFQASTFNLICMALERYFAVTKPFMHRTFFTKKKGTVVMILCWMLGLASEGWYLIYYSNILHGTCIIGLLMSTHTAHIIGFYVFFVQVILPVSVIGFASVRMWWTLKRSTSKQSNNSVSKNRDATIEKAQWNIIKTLILVYLCFIVCWTPVQVMFLCTI